MRRLALALACALLQRATAIEVEPKNVTRPSGHLCTKAYEARPNEKAFLAQAPDAEKVSGSMFGKYSIRGKQGTYVTWFGIVRTITPEGKEEDAPRALLVENKYFDGLTDTHILALSFNGGGDFTVQVGKSKEKSDQLARMRV